MSGVRERVRWTEILWGMLFEPVGLALKFHAARTDVYDKHTDGQVEINAIDANLWHFVALLLKMLEFEPFLSESIG